MVPFFFSGPAGGLQHTQLLLASIAALCKKKDRLGRLMCLYDHRLGRLIGRLITRRVDIDYYLLYRLTCTSSSHWLSSFVVRKTCSH